MDDGDRNTKAKMSGYLHLKIKKTLRSSWKSYWFVLEDRLLLYYRSKSEYEAISPCKGSISLGPPCAVKSLPSSHNAFQLVTRTVTYTLKASTSDDQKKWMQTILSALNQNQNFPETRKRLSHFRYSLDDLIPEVEPNDPNFTRQNTLPPSTKTKDKEMIQRLQKIGAHSYGGSLEVIKNATKKVRSEGAVRGSQGSLPEEDFLRTRPERNHIYERISGDSQGSERVSFLVDNENYSVPLRKSASAVDDRSTVAPRETKSLMVDNDQYGFTRKVQSEEAIYSEPKIRGRTDLNKNSVMLENSFYASCDVTENIYEDLDHFKVYSPVSVDSSQSSVDAKAKEDPSPLKKSKSFIKRVWKKKKKTKKVEMTEKTTEEALYAEIDPVDVDKVAVSDDGALQMLSELQTILENKKTKLKASVSNPVDGKEEVESQDDSETCPSLPPKTKPTQDTLKQPIEQPRSLDEILEDLDKEQIESKTKVQILIEKFSDPEDVILRKHDKFQPNDNRHSEDLNKLLDELTKVTTAPIMTPGVTSSLVNPNLTDEEWLKIIPVRQRRLSEPDYDVPRPHKTAPITPQTEDAIPATRFFGPVLQPSFDNKEESLPISMTPDSLEVEVVPKCESHYSYTSHHYSNQPDFRFSQDYDDKIIYALPKSYVSVATHVVNTCQNICGTSEDIIVYKSVKNVEVEEVFNDSLELCNETLTEF